MSRPRKEPEITYTHHINLRLTDVQYEIISENARRAELSLSEYIRRQLMKGKVIAKYELVADLPELKKLIFEFGKIGNNLNQLPATSMLEAYTLWQCGKQSDKGFLIFLK